MSYKFLEIVENNIFPIRRITHRIGRIRKPKVPGTFGLLFEEEVKYRNFI